MRGRSDVCGVEVGESADWRDRAVAYERSFGRLCADSAAPTLAAICVAGPPGGRLLDVGTGTGTVAGLARQRGFRTHGVDAEPSMVAAARDLRPGPDYVVGRLPALPYEDAAFDAVTAEYVVNHVPDPRAAVVEPGPGGRTMSAWGRVASREVYQNPWIRVREDEVVRPDGSPGVYGVVEVRSPAVFVVALTDADEVVLVTVDRYTTGTATPEVPAGGSDGDDPLVAAQRELREETGLAAEQWRRLGAVQSLNGVADATGVVFLATDLHEVGGTETEVEGISDLRTVPFAELAAMIGRGEITDNETLGALMLAVVALGRLRT